VNQPDDARLSERLQVLLVEIAQRLGPSGVALAEQAGAATTGNATATWVDVDVPDEVAKGYWPDGPLPTGATVLGVRDGVTIRVVVEPGGEGIITAFPVAP
jgi:hypothetical protein